MKNIIISLMVLFSVTLAFAQEAGRSEIGGYTEPDLVVINENMRRTSRRLRALEDGISINNDTSGTLAINRGGTNATTASDAINNLLPDQTGNEGEFLTTTGTFTQWAPVYLSFESSTTWTADVTGTVFITMCAGGGGGAGATNGAGSSGGGGGGGEGLLNYPYSVVSGNDYTVTIGAAGAGGAAGANDGTAGSNTVFDTLTVLGGSQGTAGGPGSGGSGGGISSRNGSVSSGGSAYGGGDGAPGVDDVSGGGGGASILGPGGDGENSGQPPAYGWCGGGGGAWGTTENRPGGNGTQGIVIIQK